MRSAVTITKHSLVEVRENPATLALIEDIAAQNYANAPVLLAQEYEKNNEVYLYRDSDGIAGFFMVGWSRIACDGEVEPLVFLGLSSVSHDRKGQGIGGKLYRQFMVDARRHEVETGEPVWWWFHTASSVVARSIWKIAPVVAPTPEGYCGDELLKRLECVKRVYGMNQYATEETPYLLRGIAKARYAESESERLGVLGRDLPDDLLRRLAVDERNGDRLLFVGRPPENI